MAGAVAGNGDHEVTPYYQDDSVTLYHGDCREIAEWMTADVLVTDPPYGISWAHHGGGSSRTTKVKHHGIAHDGTTALRDEILARWGTERPAIAFGSLRAPSPPEVRQTLVWRKPVDAGVVGSTLGYRTDVELIFLIGPHEKRPPSRSSVLASSGSIARYRTSHPHAKPTGLLEQLIEWTGGVVADPFAGSGSTLVAAKNLGRKAVGVELDERYCELAASRLTQDTLFGGAA